MHGAMWVISLIAGYYTIKTLIMLVAWLACEFSDMGKPKRDFAAEAKAMEWENRVVHSIQHIAHGNERPHDAAVILESMQRPGHNARVFKAVAARYTVQELGALGLVQGDGVALEAAIKAQRKAQDEAVARYYASEKAVKDATAANAAKWKN